MPFLGARVVDCDFGAAFRVRVRVGAVGHDFAGEGYDVDVVGGGVGDFAAGTQTGGVVGHVAFVGVGDEGEDGEGDGGGFHACVRWVCVCVCGWREDGDGLR